MVLHVVHLMERLHGSDNLSAGHLLVEGVHEAVGARSVVRGDRKRVEPRVQSVCLGAKGEASGHAELEARGAAKKRQSQVEM